MGPPAGTCSRPAGPPPVSVGRPLPETYAKQAALRESLRVLCDVDERLRKLEEQKQVGEGWRGGLGSLTGVAWGGGWNAWHPKG